jgi:hypothetical protein
MHSFLSGVKKESESQRGGPAPAGHASREDILNDIREMMGKYEISIDEVFGESSPSHEDSHDASRSHHEPDGN